MPVPGPADVRAAGAERLSMLPLGGLGDLIELGRSTGAVDLALGTPGWPAPSPSLVDQASAAMRSGLNQYADMRGDTSLRDQIADRFRAPTNPATEVTVTVGASEALNVATLALVDPGDEVIILEPHYENFVSAVAMASGRARFVPLRPPHWRWDSRELAEAFTSRTRMIIVNTPGNPTGRVLGTDEWREIAALCALWGVHVLSDEVYSEYVYDGRPHVSAADVPELRDRAIVVGSLSKSHAVSGWRLGFLRAAPHLTNLLRTVHTALTGGASAPLQRGVAIAGLIAAQRSDLAAEMQLRRDRTMEIFTRAGFRCRKPEGGCYVIAELPGGTGEDCTTCAHRLAKEQCVLVVPGRLFRSDRTADSGFVRVAVNRPLEVLDQAGARMLRSEALPSTAESTPDELPVPRRSVK